MERVEGTFCELKEKMVVGIVWEAGWLRTWIGRKWEGTLMKHMLMLSL